MKLETYSPMAGIWCTYDADNYDGAADATGRSTIVGHGTTAQASVADFNEQLAEIDA